MRIFALAASLAMIGPQLQAQGTQPDAAQYESVRLALVALGSGKGKAADVAGLVIRRDVATFTLERGRLWLLEPINGRNVAIAYQGSGTFAFAPAHPVEQRVLATAHKSPVLTVPIREAVFLFSDSTLAEIHAHLRFGPEAPIPEALRRRATEMVDYISDTRSKAPDPDIMADLLNGASSSLFYAHVAREGGEPVMFLLNPYEVEGVKLLGRARRTGWVRVTDVVSQSRRRGDESRAESERFAQAEVTRYTIDAVMPRRTGGELGFQAAAKLDIVARADVGPWVAFVLYDKLQVDSARWADGSRATVHKRKDASEMWLRLDRALAPGETRTVTVYYRGDLIDRFAELFFIKSSIAWYPVALEGRTKAHFDLTFTTPRSLLFASVGDKVDSADLADRMIRTRWTTREPIRNASFNLGLFKEFKPAGEQDVSVLYSDEAHRELGLRAFAREEVGRDVQNAFTFFSKVFGEPANIRRFYATEIPYDHGEAFPGLVHLSLGTFLGTDFVGFNEFFRAHEVAHQWWGIGVDYATYHDRWLSEGIASFAGLWYLQAASGKESKRYFDMLERWQSDVMLRRERSDPVWLGSRVGSASEASDYQVLVYYKGAWIIHMLRVLMLDLKTMSEERFSNAIRDFYVKHQGQRASTEDLRRTFETHAGADLGWFFDQWVYRSELPTYRVAWTTEQAEGGGHRVRLRVDQSNVPGDFQMYVPVTLDLGGGQVARLRVRVAGPRTELELPLMPSKPRDLKFNDLSGVLAEVREVSW